LSPGVLRLISEVLARLSEFIQAFSYTPRKSRQFLRAKKQEYSDQDNQ
jgi:hypothetical protein